MNFSTRKNLYRTIEEDRSTKVLAFVTGDRQGMETQIAPDVIDLFVDLLDKIGPTSKLSLNSPHERWPDCGRVAAHKPDQDPSKVGGK